MIKFDAENHIYTNERGFIIPSVTEIISYVYGTGLEDAPAQLVARAAEKGHKIHKEIEDFINGGGKAEDISAEAGHFKDYAGKHLKLEVYARTEQILHAKTPHGEFCGTADLICNGWLYDFKTSKTATREQRDKWQKQISFYWYALKQAKKSVLGAKVLHLTAEGWEEIPFDYLGDDFVEETMRKYAAREKAQKPLPVAELETVSAPALFKFAETIRQIKALEEQAETIKEAIKAEMEARKILNLQLGGINISYVAPAVRKSFDSAKFKKDHGDLWPLYQKESAVASSIRIKLES